MTFKNDAQLKAFLSKVALNAVSKTEKKVHAEFAGNLNQYYGEFIPAEYIRTGALFGSLEEAPAKDTGNGATAEVYFTVPHYQTGVMELQSTPQTGRRGYATWDGEKVLDYALHRGSHGGYVDGTSIWNESINSLGSIKGLLIDEVKKQL